MYILSQAVLIYDHCIYILYGKFTKKIPHFSFFFQVKAAPEAGVTLDLDGFNKKRKTMDTVEGETVASL